MNTLTLCKTTHFSEKSQCRTLASVLLSMLFLAGCTDSAETGGGAGDTENNVEAVELIAPLVGLYELPANWAGVPESEAYLDVQIPDDSGTAVVLIHRVSVFNNCIEPRPSQGEAMKDPFSERVFLDGLFEFDSAVLSRAGTSLNIDLPRDVQDIDNDGNTKEAASLTAERINMMASDLGNVCQ